MLRAWKPERIRPTTDIWRFVELERRLFEPAPGISTWQLAHESRQMLADVVSKLSFRSHIHSQLIRKHDAQTVREQAAIHLGSLMVRSVSSMIVLISAGYEPEALVPYRRAGRFRHGGAVARRPRGSQAASTSRPSLSAW